MSWKCDVCGKRKVIGGQITHRGLSKKKGGIGLQLVKNFKRPFYPNLQSVRVKQGKAVRRMKVCTRCIRSGKVEKA